MSYSNRPKALGDLLKGYMKRLPGNQEVRKGIVLHSWPSVVGERVASVTEKLTFDGDKLVVYVKGEAWRHELHSNRYTIRERLNREVGSDVIREVIVRC